MWFSGLAVSVLLLVPTPDARSPLDRLPQDAAGTAVRRAIQYAGGWDAWDRRTTVEFRKTTIRYRPDGSVEHQLVQLHRYILRPSFRGRIEWEEDGKKITLVNNGTHAWKVVDGREALPSEEVLAARDATFASHYVFCMPFKLTDPGAHLEYAGKEELPGGVLAEKVRVTYDKGAGDAGGLHTWTYYFDTKTGRLCANHLNYGPDKYDFTEYLDEKSIDGLRLSTRRLGFDADARGKSAPKISETRYEDIRFNVPMPETLTSP